jgi:cell wall assembly regulator SMI1
MQSLQEIWKRIETQLQIEAWFEKMHVSEVLSDFQPGATEEEIQAVEAALGIVFPEEVKTSYRIHNGSNRQALIGDPDQSLWELCSLHEVVYYWNMLEKYAAGWKVDLAHDDWLDANGQPILVRVECWNVKWIPLLHSNGTLICLDLAPTPHGHMGQIIKHDPENGTQWVAPSWQAFRSTFADDLEAGEYSYEEGTLTWS